MSKSRSHIQGRRRNVQQAKNSDDSIGDSSEDEVKSQHNKTRSPTSSNSYLNVTCRSDLSYQSDASSLSDSQKRSPRPNTSTSSSSEGHNVTRTPSSLYPNLQDIINDDSYREDIKRKENDIQNSSCDISHEGHLNFNNSASITTSGTASLLNVILFVLAAIMVALICNFLSRSNPTETANKTPALKFDTFVSYINELKQAFPNQQSRLWKTVKASSIHVLQETQPSYPAVILMSSPAQRARISRCIARKITSGFESAQGLTPVASMVDMEQLKHLDADRQKEDLDQYLKTAFSNNKRKAFVIDNLQLIDPQAAVLLHGYCDNDNAPHKDVMIVLILYSEGKPITDVDSHLMQLWSRGLEIDKVNALLSRIANNAVMIESEEDEILTKACT